MDEKNVNKRSEFLHSVISSVVMNNEDIDEIKKPVVDVAEKIVQQLETILSSNIIGNESCKRRLERIVKSIHRVFLN